MDTLDISLEHFGDQNPWNRIFLIFFCNIFYGQNPWNRMELGFWLGFFKILAILDHKKNTDTDVRPP